MLAVGGAPLDGLTRAAVESLLTGPRPISIDVELPAEGDEGGGVAPTVEAAVAAALAPPVDEEEDGDGAPGTWAAAAPVAPQRDSPPEPPPHAPPPPVPPPSSSVLAGLGGLGSEETQLVRERMHRVRRRRRSHVLPVHVRPRASSHVHSMCMACAGAP